MWKDETFLFQHKEPALKDTDIKILVKIAVFLTVTFKNTADFSATQHSSLKVCDSSRANNGNERAILKPGITQFL